MQRALRILIVHDAPAEASLLAGALRAGSQNHVEVASEVSAASCRARDEAFNAVIVSIVLADPRRGGVPELRKRFTAPLLFALPAAPAAGAFGLEPWEWVAAPFIAVDAQRAVGVAVKIHSLESRVSGVQKRVRDEEALADRGRVAARAAQDFEKMLAQLGNGLIQLREGVAPEFLGKLTALETSISRAERLCQQLHGNSTSAAPSRGPAAPMPVQVNRSTNTVLIVDDEESIRELSACVVRQAGWNAVTARDGEEALLRFQAEPGRFSAVVVDLSLPRLTGIEVVNGVRAMRPGIPVILISGHGDESLACDPRLALNGMLRKPFSTDALKAALARSLRSEALARPLVA
ncbi:response regulator [Nibricoccus sp. IMCC34717]|uniref:response regulator n=1 Tax=Nibricoccus sp. IMCC34717 TaxID=3034021 RepID=UPI00384E096E